MVTINTVVQTQINDALTAAFYLRDRYLQQPQTPFARGLIVDILDRTSLPNDVAAFNVGVVVNCPADSPLCAISVLTTYGSEVVVMIPKVALGTSQAN